MRNLNQNAFKTLIDEEEETCLVIFSRPSCHVCQKVHNTLKEVEEEFSSFNFFHVDVEKELELSNRFKIKGVPQVLFFKDGEEKFRLVGDKFFDDYAEIVEELI